MDKNFEAQYASLNDEELLHIAADREDLREEAAMALDVEMARRGLTDRQALEKETDESRLEKEEAEKYRKKRTIVGQVRDWINPTEKKP